MKIDKIKYYNFYLLISIYSILLISFLIVGKNLYVFQKVNLVYTINWSRLYIGSFIIITNILVLSVIKTKEFLYSILILVLVFFVFPSAVMFICVSNADSRILISHQIFFWITLLVGGVKFNISTPKLSPKKSYWFLTLSIIIGIIPFLVVYLPYINLNNLLLVEIYETRALIGELSNNVYINYTYSWFSKVIIPIVLVFGIYFKDKTIIFVSILSLLFLFLVGAHKAVFAGIFAMLILYKFELVKKMNRLLIVVLSLGVFSLAISFFFNQDYLMVMTIRRVLFLPALLDVLYFDYFNNNFLQWSESFSGLFKNYPYQYSHSYVIGKEYFDDILWGANNGIVSDGFMNFGMIGVVANVSIFSIFISLLNQLNISNKFFGMFFLFIISVLSSSFLTVLLSHGGILILIVSFLFLKNTEELMSK